MNREIVCARVAEIVADVESKFKISMGNVAVSFFSKGSAAGRAYSDGRVEFNEVLMDRHPEDFDNTIIHEVAHLVTNKLHPYAKQAHGPEFKRVMMIMGGEPTTYHNYDVSGLVTRKTVARFEYACAPGCVKHSVTSAFHKKMQNGATARCKHCRQPVKFTGVSASIKRG